MFPNSNKSSPKKHTQLYISEFKISFELYLEVLCTVLQRPHGVREIR